MRSESMDPEAGPCGRAGKCHNGAMPGHGERESGWRSFDSSRVGVPRRTPLWERATRELFMPLRIETPSGHVSGTIAGFRSGPIRTIRLDSTAHFGVRTPDLAEGAGAGHLTVAFAVSGRLEVRQYGRRVVLAPGEFTIYDTSDAFAVGSRLPFGARITMLPSDALNLPFGCLAGLAARPFAPGAATGIRALLAECEGSAGPGLAEVLGPLERIGRILAESASRGGETGARADRLGDEELVAAARRLVESRLADRRLSPDFVAGVLGVSRRRLYYACGRELGPLAAYIRRRRLEHASALLRDPEWGGASVAEIGRASGFEDQAHFSRLFSRAYGLPPVRARRSAE